MDLRLPQKQKNTVLKRVMLVALAITFYIADNSNLTSASSFETSSAKSNHKYRLPSEVSKPVLQFDCSKPMEKLEVTTLFETIRLDAKNCGEALNLRNEKLKHKLVTFPTGENMFSSEYAYLARGQNFFVVSNGAKEFKITVFRF